MPIVLTGLALSDAIVHRVPKVISGQTRPSPALSHSPSLLNDELCGFFERKIERATSDRNCYQVEFDPNLGEHKARAAVTSWFAGELDLVTMSQALAWQLMDAETASTSEGLLAAVPFVHGSVRCLAILKLENENGVRVQVSGEGDAQRLDLELVEDLLMTQRNRTFKLAVIVNDGEDSFSVWMADSQRGTNNREPIANFFLIGFLGCRLLISSEVATKNFYEGTMRFISERISEPVRRLEIDLHLASYLSANNPQISVDGFSGSYLHPDERSDYRTYMTQQKVPMDVFDREIELIKGKLKTIIMKGARTQLSVTGSRQAFEDAVSVSVSEDGADVMQIRDSFNVRA